MTIKETARQAAAKANPDFDAPAGIRYDNALADAVAVAVLQRLIAQCEDVDFGEEMRILRASLAEFTPAPVTPEPPPQEVDALLNHPRVSGAIDRAMTLSNDTDTVDGASHFLSALHDIAINAEQVASEARPTTEEDNAADGKDRGVTDRDVDRVAGHQVATHPQQVSTNLSPSPPPEVEPRSDEPSEWTQQLPHAHGIAKQIILNVVKEYGDEVFIADGYEPGEDLAVLISHAICDAYMGGRLRAGTVQPQEHAKATSASAAQAMTSCESATCRSALAAQAQEMPHDSESMGRWLKQDRSRCGCVLTNYERGVDQLTCAEHSTYPSARLRETPE